MNRLVFISILSGAYLCAAARVQAQNAPERAGIFPAPHSSVRAPYSSLSQPTVSAASAQKSNRRLVWGGLAIGAASGAVLGALWGKHVDRQQVCPNAGPCGGRSNAGPYALVGAALGGVLGAAVGWLARDR